MAFFGVTDAEDRASKEGRLCVKIRDPHLSSTPAVEKKCVKGLSFLKVNLKHFFKLRKLQLFLDFEF